MSQISPVRPVKILLVEDDLALLEVVRDILSDTGYEVMTATNGREGLQAFRLFRPDLILSDIMMPNMDGFELLEAVRQMEEGMLAPFIFMSARTERYDTSNARRLGADDYLFKPFSAEELLTAVEARLRRREQISLFSTREAHLQTVVMLASAIEERDVTTSGHVDRVRTLALAFADYLGWSPEIKMILEIGALLHDIGKIVVPEHILNKPAPLTDEEMEVMKRHPTSGARILKGVSHLAPAAPYILYHHERWDGRGYPFGLKGDEIPIEGRFLALVDAYDAMTSDRPYRRGLPRERAMQIIRENLGTQFDPDLGERFLNMLAESAQL
ncbi:HD-GYP domain-containing protein [Anaerolinea sp.]|uniref:HD-GYP domain-containing protein n=1 Tax=Anaerolinea sp. TaxID=1872519 RepID=UPI00260B6F28|nr:HD domain-containing phosphohydrolase [uncultured Anaerolinea sp.]